MFIAPIVLALLIISTPVTLIVDGPMVHGLVTAAAATSVASIALQFRPGEAQFLSLLIRPVAIIAAFPALWMLFQVLPLNSVGLANPIWESAATALGHSLAGSISRAPAQL
jgi:multidrug transporter EmrE-like cation transporter